MLKHGIVTLNIAPNSATMEPTLYPTLSPTHEPSKWCSKLKRVDGGSIKTHTIAAYVPQSNIPYVNDANTFSVSCKYARMIEPLIETTSLTLHNKNIGAYAIPNTVAVRTLA